MSPEKQNPGLQSASRTYLCCEDLARQRKLNKCLSDEHQRCTPTRYNKKIQIKVTFRSEQRPTERRDEEPEEEEAEDVSTACDVMWTPANGFRGHEASWRLLLVLHLPITLTQFQTFTLYPPDVLLIIRSQSHI